MIAAEERLQTDAGAVWDRAWSSHDRPPTDCHERLVAIVARLARPLREKRVLEVGAGSARDTLRLAELGARSVAVDLSATALRLARRGMQARRVEIGLVMGNGYALPFQSASFDVVFSQGVVEHFSDPLPLLAEQVRVLKPGGLLLIDVPQTVNLYTIHKWLQMRAGKWFAGWETSYTLPQLEALARRCGLEVVGSYGSGYYPALFLGLRNLHTLSERRRLPIWIGARLQRRIERKWAWLERQRWYYRWMWNIGVVATRRAPVPAISGAGPRAATVDPEPGWAGPGTGGST